MDDGSHAADRPARPERDLAQHRRRLSLHAYEDLAGPGIACTEHSLDDGQTWTTGTSLVIVAPADHSNDGADPLGYRSIDNAGTVEPTRIAVVGIDTREPTAVAEGASTAWRRTPPA